MNRKVLYWCICLSILAGAGCSRQPDNPVPFYVSCITRGQWQLIRNVLYIKTSGGTTTSDQLAAMPSCRRDNIFTFRADSTRTSGDMIIDEGLTKCDSSDPQFPQPLWWNLGWGTTTFVISDHDMARLYGIELIDTGFIALRSEEGYDPYSGTISSEEITYMRVR